MRSKKSFLSLGIIVLVLFLGVGYAVVSSVYLNIGGTASVANADLKVEITDVVATTSVSGKDLDFTNELSNKNLNSNFTLNGMELNEKVTITYTVTNNETDVDAEIKLASGVELTNSNVDFFDVNYTIPDSVTDLANGDKTMTVVVTVELIQTPVTEEEGTTTVGLKLAAIPKGGSENAGSSDVVATEIYYNQPYNAVVSTETVASDTATYARNGQTYNVTSLYNNVSELQVNARTLAETNSDVVKTLVVYDDLSVEIFVDGVLSTTYPSSSVVIEGQTLNVTDGFEAQISSDFKTITVNDEVYELNVTVSPLLVGGNHMYSAYVEETQDQMMAMGVVFKDNTHLDVYFNGNLFGETSTEYYTVGNKIYTVDDGGPASLYGYLSLDGTQIISKGVTIFQYQGFEDYYYGRAYSTFYGTGFYEQVKLSIIPYRDNSFDILYDDVIVDIAPAGSITFSDGIYQLSLGDTSFYSRIKNDGLEFALVEDGVETGFGLILENVRARSNVLDKKFLAYDNETNLGEVTFGPGSNYSATYSDGDTTSGKYIISDHALIADYGPVVMYYDETTNQYVRTFNSYGSLRTVKLVPAE